MRQLKFGNQIIQETPSGKTWKFFIRKAFWDNTVGIRKKIVDLACKKFERRIQFNVLNPPVNFTIPAWKIKLTCPLQEFVGKFPDNPMKMYMVKIPREKLIKIKKK